MAKLLDKLFGSAKLQKAEEKATGSEESVDISPQKPDQQTKRTPNRVRNKSLTLRLSDEELEEINTKITESGLAKNEFVLNCIRGKRVIVVNDLVAIKAEIHRQGVNINQMARAHNEYAVALGSFGIRIANEVREYRELNGRLEAMAIDLQRIEDCLANIQAQLDEEG